MSFYSVIVFLFKHKTAYEMRISDWSSDVCSSDLRRHRYGDGVMSGNSYDPLKRLIDLAAGLVGLIVTLPLQAVLAVLVRRKLGSPILFRQQIGRAHV